MLFAAVASLVLTSPAPASTPLAPASLASPSVTGADGFVPRRMPAHPIAVPAEDALVRNSGSTNTSPYVILVSPSGDVTSIAGGSGDGLTVPKPLVDRLFADLRASEPLAPLGRGGCMKSASFGSTTTVLWHGTLSGDLSCGAGARVAALQADISAIVSASGMTPLPHGRRRPMAEPVTSPAASAAP